jgi:hypothetical protein
MTAMPRSTRGRGRLERHERADLIVDIFESSRGRKVRAGQVLELGASWSVHA